MQGLTGRLVTKDEMMRTQPRPRHAWMMRSLFLAYLVCTPVGTLAYDPSQPGSLWLAGSLFLSGVFLMPVLALLIAGQLQLIRLKRLPGWVDNLAAGMALAVVIVTVLLWAIR